MNKEIRLEKPKIRYKPPTKPEDIIREIYPIWDVSRKQTKLFKMFDEILK